MGKKKGKNKGNRSQENQVANQTTSSLPRTGLDAEAWLFIAIAVLFVLSGASSLVYQVVWTRMLVLVFGATTFATSTVLSIFMGGLALGSFIGGRAADRVKSPLLWYGILEGVIGAWALAAPFMFDAATPLYKYVWQITHAELIPFSLLRFAIATLILIVPTTCMGATLPLLSKFVTTGLDVVGKKVGTLYACNTLGAVAGAVSAGFYMLPMFGLRTSTIIAAVINFLLLGAVWQLKKYVDKRDAAAAGESAQSVGASGENSPDGTVPAAGAKPLRLPFEAKVILTCFAISGGLSMIYEVCWTRALLMVIGSSTYAFTIMLAAFLIGIFGGSLFAANFVDRTKRPLLWFSVLQVMIAMLTFSGMVNFNSIPYFNLLIADLFPFDSGFGMFVRLLVSGMVLVPITLCLGATFPVVVKACATDLEALGRSVGTVYSANTLGAIIGAFIGGFIAIPAFGTEKTLLYASLINVVMFIVLFWLVKPIPRMVRVAVAVVCLGAIAYGAIMPDVWNKSVILTAQSQRRKLREHRFGFNSYEDWLSAVESQGDIKYYKDGICSNVGVIVFSRRKTTSLFTNGHIDASDTGDVPVQSLLSAFPMMFAPNAKDIAVIGWGSGQTVGVARLFPVESIEAIELEPAVIEASKFFHHVNHKPETDPRVKVIINDGRNFMLATDKKYDIIVSEPSNPWQSGVCNLFTKEYFEICKQRLKPGGILSCWMQTAEVPPADLFAVLSAMRKVYPHVLVMYPKAGNVCLLGSDHKLVLDLPAVKRMYENAEFREEMVRSKLPKPESSIGRIIVAEDGFASTLTSKFQNSDDLNALEFDVGRTYEEELFTGPNRAMLAAMAGDPRAHVNWGDISDDEKAKLLCTVAQEAADANDRRLGLMWAGESNNLKENVDALRIGGAICNEEDRHKDADRLLSRALELQPGNVDVLLLRGASRAKDGKVELGRADFLAVLKMHPDNLMAKYLLATSYRKDLNGDPIKPGHKEWASAAHAVSYIAPVVANKNFIAEHPGALFLAGQANYKAGNFVEARRNMSAYAKARPDSKIAQDYLQKIEKAQSLPSTLVKDDNNKAIPARAQ